MIINLEKNKLIVTNENKTPAITAHLNFERVIDTEQDSLIKDIGILPIFSVYVFGISDDEKIKGLYKDYYKQMLLMFSTLFPETYYINTFEDTEVIYCMKDCMLETNDMVKIPHKTSLKIYRD